MLTQDKEALTQEGAGAPSVTLPAAAVAGSPDLSNIALTPPGSASAASTTATLAPAPAPTSDLAAVFSPPARSQEPPAAPPVAAPAQVAPATTVEETVPETTGSGAAVTDNAAVESQEGDDELEPLPLASEPTGIIGLGAKMLRSKTAELADHEKVKQSVQFVKEKATAVGDKVRESEKVQQSVQYVKTKTTEIVESERVRKSVEVVKEKAAVAKEKAGEVSEMVTEKSKQGYEYAKEKTKGLREGAGGVWESGRGSIQRVRANVSNLAWKGSARDTLDIAAREEQWKGIKIQGAEEIGVPARTEHTCCYHVSKGSTLRWTFRVKEHDIGFGVRMRVQEWGGSREDEVLSVERYDASDTISGSWVADEDRTMVLVFDNKYSKLRSKTVAYFTGTEKPPVFVESPSVDVAAASLEPTRPADGAAPAAPAASPAPATASAAAAPAAAAAAAGLPAAPTEPEAVAPAATPAVAAAPAAPAAPAAEAPPRPIV